MDGTQNTPATLLKRIDNMTFLSFFELKHDVVGVFERLSCALSLVGMNHVTLARYSFTVESVLARSFETLVNSAGTSCRTY